MREAIERVPAGIAVVATLLLVGHGVSLAPASAGRYYARPGITFATVTDAAPSVVALARRRNRTPSPLARAFINACQRIATPEPLTATARVSNPEFT